jgi:hypothetical protein
VKIYICCAGIVTSTEADLHTLIHISKGTEPQCKSYKGISTCYFSSPRVYSFKMVIHSMIILLMTQINSVFTILVIRLHK